ncbi:MAG: hypothetical protein E7168_02520 [Firmicutes bacterium]|nr:hypothetical protein [Bacillota bacterium]
MKNLTIGTFNADCDYSLEKAIYKEKAEFIINQIKENDIEVMAIQHASPLLISILEQELFSVDRQICTSKERVHTKKNLDNIIISNSKMKGYTLRCYLPVWPTFKELKKNPFHIQKNVVTIDRIMPINNEEINVLNLNCNTPYPTLQDKYLEEILVDTYIVQELDTIGIGTLNLPEEKLKYLKDKLTEINMQLIPLLGSKKSQEQIIIPNNWEVDYTESVESSFHNKRPLVYADLSKKK